MRIVDFDVFDSLKREVVELEKETEPACLVLVDSDINRMLEIFKKQFIEVPAAGGLVRNNAKEWLFIRRLGCWDLPKGKINKGEATVDAALREVEEECGLTHLKIIKQLNSTFHMYRSPYLSYPNNLVFKQTVWYLMEYEGSEVPTPQYEEDIDEVRWVKESELKLVLSNTYPGLREFIMKSLRI